MNCQVKRNTRCKVIFLSGVRDFDNIYRVIQSPNARFLTKMEPAERILAVAREVLGEVEQQDSRLAQEQYHALLYCLSASQTQHPRAEERLRAMDGPVVFERGTAFACFTMRQAWAYDAQQDAMTRLASLAPECADGEPFHFLRTGGDQAVLIMQLAADGAALPSRLAALCRRAGQTGGQPLCVYAAGYRTLPDLLAACREAQSLSRRIYAPSDSPIPLAQARELGTGARRDAFAQVDFQLQLAQSFLALGQKDSFTRLACELFERCLTPSLNPGCAMYVYSSVLSMLIHAPAAARHPDLVDHLKGERFLTPATMAEWHQARQRLHDACTLAFDTLFPADPYANAEVIAGIQQYIQDHLDHDLSLNALSARFNLTPNYLSRYFKENTGRNLHDYISELRLGTAKQLLLNSNDHIKEIASRVGYDSAHTFIRAFRRRFGATPAEYRGRKGRAR